MATFFYKFKSGTKKELFGNTKKLPEIDIIQVLAVTKPSIFEGLTEQEKTALRFAVNSQYRI